MNGTGPQKHRLPGPLLLLHGVAAVVCFVFFATVPIGACLVFMVIGNDMGGPMFLPIFVLGVVFSAAIITAVLGGAALSHELLRQRYRVPFWSFPLGVFALATTSSWLLFSAAQPALAPMIGGIITLAFVVHTTAITVAWRLRTQLFQFFGAERFLTET